MLVIPPPDIAMEIYESRNQYNQKLSAHKVNSVGK
jgi:hypothetical protein